MKKKDILKMHGLTEEQFYKLYPTEESYKMAMGGTPFAQFFQKGGGSENILKSQFIAPSNAVKVDKPGEGFSLMPGQDPNALKTYYDKQIAEAKPGTQGDAGKHKEWLIQQLQSGISPKELIKKKHMAPGMLPEMKKYYQPQYIEKAKPIEQPKTIDLGIGWAGERKEVFGHYMPKFKDSTGQEHNIQQFKVPARWNEKTKSWDTESAWNDPTVLTGYQQNGKFVTFDPSASKLAYQGETPYFTQEGLKYPSYVQSGEDQKVMKTGPLTISGATAVDVQNTGMNYNPNKDVVAPINTRGTGRGIGQDTLINTIGVPNLPTGTGMTNYQFGGFQPDFYNPPYLLMKDGGYMPMLPEWMKMGGAPCFECGGQHMKDGGLSRSEDYGSKKKPYPSISSSDFAGGDRSYPIPTKADAIDALRLAGLHGRSDVRAKVFAKYPELKKQFGGAMSADLEGSYPTFNYGGMDFMYGGDPSLHAISSKESLKMFKNLAKGGQPAFPGQNQDSKLDQIKNDFMSYIRNSTMDAIARDEHANMISGMFQFGGNNPYGYNPNMNNQQAFYNAGMQGNERFQQDMGNFMSATQNLGNTMTPYTQTSITKADDGMEVAPWWKRGYTYFPMNYEPMMKMSNKDIETMQMLAANPTTNLKEFHAKKRLFGPGVRRVDMVFGSKPRLQSMDNLKDYIPPTNEPKDIHVIRDPKREMNLGPEIQTTPNPNFSWNTNFQMGGWNFAGAQQPQFTTPESVGIQTDPIYKTQMQDTGAPPVSGDPLTNYGPEQQYKVTQKFKNKWDPEATANWAMAGMSALASAFEQKDARKNMEKWKSMQGADNQFYSMPGGNRGDYDQFGNFRPNQKVPVQFAGQNFGQTGTPYTFQEGGEYYMTDDQINSIIEGGGEIEFLD